MKNKVKDILSISKIKKSEMVEKTKCCKDRFNEFVFILRKFEKILELSGK